MSIIALEITMMNKLISYLKFIDSSGLDRYKTNSILFLNMYIAAICLDE